MAVIKFENISKQYRLGLVSTQTLSHDLNRWWKTAVLHKEDPYLKIGEINDRSAKGKSDYVWALRDINFEIEQGDVVGIIGKNGAGKSTLLKLLSRVTMPTTGMICAKGRIASLLEVGTGFHPEMTGRENIFMNGAIMGMTKQEIKRKLDEIVDFSGCERYIDTPVNRYSSGLTGRLGFAIAAHLEPDILVVDEVLAVGDAEFQKKAIGKMQDVSRGEGRTVLFVSHNMGSIQSLCNQGILLDKGTILNQGPIQNIVGLYRNLCSNHNDTFSFTSKERQQKSSYFTDFTVDVEGKSTSSVEINDRIKFKFRVFSKEKKNVTMRVALFDQDEVRVLSFDSKDFGKDFELKENEESTFSCLLTEPLMIKPGFYKLNISMRQGAIIVDHICDVVRLEVLDSNLNGQISYPDLGICLKQHTWKNE